MYIHLTLYKQMLFWIVNIKKQYLKPFNCMQTNEFWVA